MRKIKLSLRDLLKCKFPRDKTIVRVISKAREVTDFAKDFYRIYLSNGDPRVYNDRNKEIYHHSICGDWAYKIFFEVNEKDITWYPRFGDMSPRGDESLEKGNQIQEKMFNDLYQPITNKCEEILMRRVINRLNGIKLADESMVQLHQDVSNQDKIEIDLLALLKDSETIKKLGFGKESILKGINICGSKLSLDISIGEVEREIDDTVTKALNELIKNK